MPIELEIPGLGLMEFPDDVSREELESFLPEIDRYQKRIAESNAMKDLTRTFSGIHLDPYQQATVKMGQRPESGMESGTELIESMAQGPTGIPAVNYGLSMAKLPASIIGTGVHGIQQKVFEPIGAAYFKYNPSLAAIRYLANQAGQAALGLDVIPEPKPGVSQLESIVDMPQEDEQGFGPSMLRFTAGMTTPGSLATLPLAGGRAGAALAAGGRYGAQYIPRAVSGTFGAGILSSIPESIEAVYQAQTPEEVAGAATDLGISLGFGGLMARQYATHKPGFAKEWTEKAKQRNQQLKDEYASREQKAAEVYGDVRAQPGEVKKEVSAEDSGQGVLPGAETVAESPQVSLEREIAKLEQDPEVTGRSVTGTAPDGTPIFENVMTSQAKLGRLRELRRMRDGGLPQHNELDIAVEEAEAEFKLEAEKIGKKVEPLTSEEQKSVEDPNVPFASGAWSRPTASGNIGINRLAFRRRVYLWLRNGMTSEQIKKAVQAHVGEEFIHSHVTNLDSARYARNASALERALALFKYSGSFTRAGFEKEYGRPMTDAWLGHEMIRQRQQRMRGMTVSEVADAARAEKWDIQTIQVLEDALRLARKDSPSQIAVLKKVQKRLDAAREAVKEEGEKPASMTRHTTDLERQIDELPSDFRDEIRDFFHQKAMNPAIDDAWRRVVAEMQKETPEGEEMPTEVQAAYVLTMFGGHPQFARHNPAMNAAWDNFRNTVIREKRPESFPASFTKDPSGDAARKYWEEIRKEQYGKRKKQMGTNITPLGFIKGGLFEGQPNIGSGAPGEHPTGKEFGLKERVPITAKELQEAAVQIANGPITFKVSKVGWRRREQSAAALKLLNDPNAKLTDAEREELSKRESAPKQSVEQRPSYRAFREWVSRNVHHPVEEEALRQIWKDAIMDELSNASPERASQWRAAYGLETRYGERPMIGPSPLSKITPKAAIPPEVVRANRKARAQVWVDRAKKIQEIIDVVPAVPGTRGFELIKQMKRKVRAYMTNARDIMAGKPLPLEEVESAAERETRYWKGGQVSSPEIYRAQVLTDVLRRNLAEMQVPEKALDREFITVSEVDFENKQVEFPPWLELSESDLNPKRLADILTDGARTSGEPITQTRVLLAMADKHGRGVQLVSVYPHGKGEVRATMPGLKPLTRPNRPIREVMVNYRPFLRILLKEPVRNFHQSFKNMDEFRKAIGDRGREIAAGIEWGKFAGEEYIPAGERLSALKGLSREDMEKAGLHETMSEEEIQSRMEEGVQGEGGMFQGTQADVARAGAGVGRIPGLTQRRGSWNISASEANAVRSVIERNRENIDSPEQLWEVVQALKNKFDNRTLSGRDWTTILALRKGARAIRRFYPWYSENEAIAATIKSFYEAATKAKDEAGYLAQIAGTFNQPVKDVRPAGPATPLFRQAPKSAGPAAEELARRFPTGEELKTLADIEAFEKQRTRVGARPEPVSREVTMIPRRAPTSVLPANIPAEMVARMEAERAARKARPTEVGPAKPPPAKLGLRGRIGLEREMRKARAEMEPTMPYYDIHKAKPVGEPITTEPFPPGQKRARRIVHRRTEDQPASFTKDEVKARTREALDWMKSPVVPEPQAVTVDLANPVPRFPSNVSDALTRATGIERIPIIGKLWGPRANIKDAADRELIGYAVKRNMGNSMAALIGKEIRDVAVRLKEPFKVGKDGQLLNVNAKPEASLHPSDVFERWQVETLIPELMAGVKGVTKDDIAEYVRKNPTHYALTKQQDLLFRTIYEYVRDAYRYLDEKKESLDISDRKPQSLEGFSGELAVYPLPRVALYKKSIGPLKTGYQRRIGGSYQVENERLYKTEREGADTTVYEPDMAQRVMVLLSRVYKAVADGELARSEGLGGKTVDEMRVLLSKKYEEKIRSGQMSLKNIEQMAYQGEKDVSRSVLSGHPAFADKVYLESVASRLERAFGERAHQWVRAAGEISKLQKGFMLTADAAQFFQQGLPMMLRNPKMWSRALAGSLEALNDPNILGRVVRDPRLKESAIIFIQHGGSMGHLQDFMSGAMPGEPAARVPGFRQLVLRSGQSFGTFLDLSKLYLFDALRRNAPKEQWAEIARSVEDITLSSSMEASGLHPGRAFGERILFMAASYYRAAFQLIAGAAEGAYHLSRGKGGAHVASVESLKTLSTMMASMTLGMTGMYLASGMSKDEIKKRLNPANSEFLTFPVPVGGGRTTDVGLGGIIINLASLAGRVVDTAVNSPSSFAEIGPENPFIWWFRTKLGPLPGLAFSWLTGKDVLGRTTGFWKSLGRTLTPISASAAMDVGAREKLVPAVVESTASFVGARAATSGPQGKLRKIVDKYLKESNDPRLQNLFKTRRKMYGLVDSDYSALKSSLVKKDPKMFAKEYAKLLEIKGRPDKSARDVIDDALRHRSDKGGVRAITGLSKADERELVGQMTPDEQKIYEEALNEREELYDRFKDFLMRQPD